MPGPIALTRRWLLLTLHCRRSWPLALLVLLPLLPVAGAPRAQSQAASSCVPLAVRAVRMAQTATTAIPVVADRSPRHPPAILLPNRLPACDRQRIRGPPMG